MKRLLCLLLFATVVRPASAEDRAAEILARLSAEFRRMESYEVRFDVAGEGFAATGRYAVSGSSYCLTIGDAEIFADGAVRYEVDHARREVTIVEVDTASRNILNNPVRAFDFLGDEYAASLLSETEGRAVVRLTPRAARRGGGASSSVGDGVDDITLTVDVASMRPLSLVYAYDGERITVRILSLSKDGIRVRAFDSKACEGYELIDFR